MNFIGCSGDWTLGAANEIGCSGALTAYTETELQAVISPSALTIEDATQLLWLAVPVFVAVFVVLVIKKVL